MSPYDEFMRMLSNGGNKKEKLVKVADMTQEEIGAWEKLDKMASDMQKMASIMEKKKSDFWFDLRSRIDRLDRGNLTLNTEDHEIMERIEDKTEENND